MLDGKIICTKPKNIARFFRGYNSGRLDCVICVSDKLGLLFSVDHLREIDGACSERAAHGQVEYEPALDIDRYAIDCVHHNGELCRCAVLDEIARAIDDQRRKSVGLDAKPVKRERAPYIRGGNGDVGVVSPVADSEFDFLPSDTELCVICQTCKARTTDRDDKRQERDDDADKSNKDTDKSNQDAKMFRLECSEKVHGGIIAFILFAIASVLLLVLCGCSGGVSIIDSPITAIRDQTKVLESIDKSLKAIAAAYDVQDIGR